MHLGCEMGSTSDHHQRNCQCFCFCDDLLCLYRVEQRSAVLQFNKHWVFYFSTECKDLKAYMYQLKVIFNYSGVDRRRISHQSELGFPRENFRGKTEVQRGFCDETAVYSEKPPRTVAEKNAVLHCYNAFSAILSDRGLSGRGASSIHRVGKKRRHFLGSEHRTNEMSWYFVLLTLGLGFFLLFLLSWIAFTRATKMMNITLVRLEWQWQCSVIIDRRHSFLV